MREAAEQLRSASGGDSARPDPGKAKEQAAKAAATEQDAGAGVRTARRRARRGAGFGRRLVSGSSPISAARAQALQQEIDRLTGELEKRVTAGAVERRTERAQVSAGGTGQQVGGRSGGGEGGGDPAKLR